MHLIFTKCLILTDDLFIQLIKAKKSHEKMFERSNTFYLKKNSKQSSKNMKSLKTSFDVETDFKLNTIIMTSGRGMD